MESGLPRVVWTDSGGFGKPQPAKNYTRFPILTRLKKGGCSIYFTPDGTTALLVKGSHSRVQVFDAHSGTLKTEYDLDPDSAGGPDMAISPDGRQFVTCTFHAQAYVYDLDTGHKLGECEKGHSDVSQVAYSTDGRWIAAGHHHGSIQLLDAATRTQKFVLHHERAHVAGLAFSPDGRHLAAATSLTMIRHTSREIRIWRIDLTLVQADDGHEGKKRWQWSIKTNQKPF